MILPSSWGLTSPPLGAQPHDLVGQWDVSKHDLAEAGKSPVCGGLFSLAALEPEVHEDKPGLNCSWRVRSEAENQGVMANRTATFQT